MNTILVPTDFSKNASNALNYAIAFAASQKAKLLLFHSFLVNYEDSDYPENTLVEMKAEAYKKLRTLSLRVSKVKGLECDYYCMEGATVKSILDTAKEREVSMIIMGTKGESDIASVVFGSNAAAVIGKAECPVIAVPEDATFAPIKKITFATNYNNSDLNILKTLVSIAEPFHAQLNIVHIAGKDESPLSEVEQMENFMKKVLKKTDYNNTSFQMLNSDDIEQELLDYVDAGSTDMLVMSTHKRSFWEKIFKTSITNDMAYLSQIPLMAFHYKKASVNVFA